MNARYLAMHLLRFQMKTPPRVVTVKQLDEIAKHIDLLIYQHELLGEEIGLNDLLNLNIDLKEIKKIMKEAKQ